MPLYSYWHDEQGTFLVMRYIRGGSLRSMIARQGALPVTHTIRIIEQIADALQFAHESGIVHRDLKPDNILIDERGNAYLTDFGIAKNISNENLTTATDAVKGTFAYISPEQIQQNQVSSQTDIYALGVMLYEMLTGQHPFHETPIIMMVMKHLQEPLPDIREIRSDLHTDIDDIIQRATLKNPADRYASTLDLAEDLQKTINAEPAALPSVSTPPKIPYSPEHRNRYTMITNIRKFWIEGVLDNALHQYLIRLQLTTGHAKIERPWDAMLRKEGIDNETRLESDSILDIFEQSNGKLLILGAPGSGKTTLLLELLRHLLDRADAELEYPIPVLVNLSSWEQSMPPLLDWLSWELSEQYYVPSDVAKGWLQKDQLTLLLDGLDEISESRRDRCVNAINEFRRSHGFMDIVVCSRVADYEILPNHLLLNAIVQIQNLNDARIFQYLETFKSNSVSTFRTVLEKDPDLLDVCRTPFILVMMVVAYSNIEAGEISYFETPAERRNHLFHTYIQRMLQYNIDSESLSNTQIQDYLTYIARQMQKQSIITFSTNDIQPAWLPDDEKVRIIQYAEFTYWGLILISLVIPTAVLWITEIWLIVLFIPIIGFYSLMIHTGSQTIALGGTMQILFRPTELAYVVISFITVTLFFSIHESIMFTSILLVLIGIKEAYDTRIQSQTHQQLSKVQRSLRAMTRAILVSFPAILIPVSIIINPVAGVLTAIMTTIWVTLLKLDGYGLILSGMLRLYLWRNHYLPLNVKMLMETAVNLMFVRQVGVAYIFIHRYLLEYFAEQYQTQSSKNE